MSKLELLEKCKELGIKMCSSKNKGELIELLKSPIEMVLEEKKSVKNR